MSEARINELTNAIIELRRRAYASGYADGRVGLAGEIRADRGADEDTEERANAMRNANEKVWKLIEALTQ